MDTVYSTFPETVAFIHVPRMSPSLVTLWLLTSQHKPVTNAVVDYRSGIGADAL
jgi:hypothetical protein